MAEKMDIDDDENKMADENDNSLIGKKEAKNVTSPKIDKRLEYLLEQAELFSHFVGDSPTQANKRQSASKKKKLANNDDGKGGRRNRAPSATDNGDDDDNEPKAADVRFDTTPSYIVGEMRDYQIRALNWLISLYRKNINGILADEMGLGKTLQTISMLGFLKHYEKINGPFLVVGPKSTLRNWLNEVKRFCPTFKPITLIGERSERVETLNGMKDQKSWDICLTTYEMCLAESTALKRIQWKYLVIDEAHRIKNENSKLSQILRKFHSKNRLLLTGTPLQNNLHELWALLNFLLPDVFASADDFDTWFDSDDCLRGNDSIVTRLRKILSPFMLRRIKSEVEKSLLPKIELKLFVGLTPLQRETYRKVLAKELTKLNEMGEETAKALDMIVMELRKAANHPYLVEGTEPGPPYTTDQHLVDSCGKMMVLDKLLAKLQSQGSRVVMFSQFKMMLDILEDYLIWRGYKYRRLDGDTSYDDRGKHIDEFNAENSDIFIYIISTRAGGLGINLATADVAIIYDSDWNPQPDFQAIDRVHRIGQKKQVRVFRLVTENTIDQRIVERAEIKVRLDRMVIQQGRTVDKNQRDLTKGSKRDMIRFGAEHILSKNASDVIDIDIDKVLKYGELKTAEENAKYAEMGESQLRNLTLEEASSVSVYQFEGVDFRAGHKKNSEENGDEIYGFRQRKTVQYFPPILAAPSQKEQPVRKLQFLPDFHFYPSALLNLCDDKDRWIDMAIDTAKKTALMAQAFTHWKRNEMKAFCKAMEKFGRNDLAKIVTMLPDKTLDDVTKYHATFWNRGPSELTDFERLIAPIKKAELMASRAENFSQALQWKMQCYRNPEVDLTVSKLSKNGHTKVMYTQQQDSFILMSLCKYGINSPNVYDCIRQDILRSGKFRFDFFIRGRTANELNHRAKILLNAIQREYEESLKKKEKEPVKPLNATLPNDLNKGLDKGLDQNHNKKAKRKSWMPTITFRSAHKDEPKAKKNAANFGDLNDGASTSYASTLNGFASTSGVTNKSLASAKMAFNMPLLE